MKFSVFSATLGKNAKFQDLTPRLVYQRQLMQVARFSNGTPAVRLMYFN